MVATQWTMQLVIWYSKSMMLDTGLLRPMEGEAAPSNANNHLPSAPMEAWMKLKGNSCAQVTPPGANVYVGRLGCLTLT